MNGNVTREGLKLDLQWLQRIGIGGVHNFDAAFEGGTPFDVPQVVSEPIVYLSPQWRRLKRYSVRLAARLGLDFGISSAAGWGTGGPWVKPHQAMKKLVWSENVLTGGVPFKGYLRQPPGVTGLFQGIQLAPVGAAQSRSTTAVSYYQDIATIAYKSPETEAAGPSEDVVVTSSVGAVDAGLLSGSEFERGVELPFGLDSRAWIRFSFAQPRRIQALSVATRRPPSWNPLLEPGPRGWLEVDDGSGEAHKIVELPNGRSHQSSALRQTIAFAPVEARTFRVVFERSPLPDCSEVPSQADSPAAHYILELTLHTAPRVNRFEDKAGFSTRLIADEDDTARTRATEVISKVDIIDLTSLTADDGLLTWTPPSGHWVVMRFGYSLTGRTNVPAAAAGTGLEIDKLSRKYAESYIAEYLESFERTLGPSLIGSRGLRHMIMDSYEAGPQNWTDDLLVQFKQRRGYDLLPWLPVLAGRVVESSLVSDRLLWDFRKTLGELIVDEHYGRISTLLHERKLRRYGESHEFSRALIGDGMAVKKSADVPMGAMWAARFPNVEPENYDADIRESASVAHVYGKSLVGGESFTAYGNTFGFTPENLKPFADRAMAMGLNHFVIHTSVHQPDSLPGPGVTFGPFGIWFTRKETWAELAGAFITYLTRSSFLLQQGSFVADLAYLYGEDANVTALFQGSEPSVPPGYNFDFVNADIVMNEFAVEDGRIVTRGGMVYRALLLDASTRRMTLPVLRKIRQMVSAGAVVIGKRPESTPSLADDELEFESIASELWREPIAANLDSVRTTSEALAFRQIFPDVIFTLPSAVKLRFVHRALREGDIYFISNGTPFFQQTEASFRISGRRPELWRADTGSIEPISYRIGRGRTTVCLRLEPNDAVFVVFRRETNERNFLVSRSTVNSVVQLDGAWDLTFPEGLGAPLSTRFEELHSWTLSADLGVRFFSGTATYFRALSISCEVLNRRSRLVLDLGEVRDLAEVILNGRSAGILWKAPFRIDVTELLREGENRLEIKVTNLWPNRLIGDKQPGMKKIAFATYDPFATNSPLLPSGLLGPVQLTEVLHSTDFMGANELKREG